MALSNSAVCRSKKLKFIKEQEAIGILGNKLRTKILVLRNIPIANILFQSYQRINTKNKMNEIVNKFLLTADKFMSKFKN